MRQVLLAAALLALGACAGTGTTATADNAQPATRDCFRNDDISGFSVLDDRHVKVSVGPNRDYSLTTMSRVSELDFELHMAIRSRGSSWICTGRANDVEIFSAGSIPRTWTITDVQRIPETPPQAPTGS